MIALTLNGKTIEEDYNLIRECRFADIAELRVDLLDDIDVEGIIGFPDSVGIPIILTVRKPEDGGRSELDEKERENLVSELLCGNFSYVDIEKGRMDGALSRAHERGIRVIRSVHDFEKIPEDTEKWLQSVIESGDIPKIAATPGSVSDLLRLFKLSEIEGDKIIVGMGDYGVPVRILYKKAGSILTYGSVGKAVAPGQIPAAELKGMYRSDSVDSNTEIFGIIGNPVLHSSSPLIHNSRYIEKGMNAIYVPFPTDSVDSFMLLADYLGVGGFSITMPYKSDIISRLSDISDEVRAIGSCNTAVRENGRWKGYNKDAPGFIKPIKGYIDCGKIRTALVMGAGGAASAIIWALKNEGVDVTVLNRNVGRAREKAERFGVKYAPAENMNDYIGADLLVQATSVGMVPDTEKSSFEGFDFSGSKYAYDIVYKPEMTKFLNDAVKAGLCPVFGREMLEAQAELQFNSFCGRPRD